MPKDVRRKIPLTEIIRSLFPVTLMGKLMVVGVFFWFIDWVLVNGDSLFGSRLLKHLIDIASALAFIPLIYFIFKTARWVAQRLLWRLRRRLIVTYLLIGALPAILLTLLVMLSGYALVMQTGANLAARQLDGYLEQSHTAAVSLTQELSGLGLDQSNQANQVNRANEANEANEASEDRLRNRLQAAAQTLGPVFPGIVLSLGPVGTTGQTITVTSSAQTPATRADLAKFPRWVEGRKEFDGLTVHEDADQGRQIWVRHVHKLSPSSPIIFHMRYPVAEDLCARISRTTDLQLKPGRAIIPLIMTTTGPQVDQPRLAELESRARPENISGGIPVFKPITEWETGRDIESDALSVDSSFLLPNQLWRRVQQFRSGSAIGRVLVWAIGGLGLFFLLLALVAIASAIYLTTSITRAIHHLYAGTKRVEDGDFDKAIPIMGSDQLASLSKSFNSMTRSIRELLNVSAEKQRLDQEMRIAAQVQSMLFPRATPATTKLDFAPGVCIPARAVSGDYYDFIEVATGVIGIVVADVCGKGVSAALMMANLQASLRGHVQAYHDAYNFKLSLGAPSEMTTELVAEPKAEGGAAVRHQFEDKSGDKPARPVTIQRIVQRVNQQVADSVIDASFITLFYAEFDEHNSTLRYTNAGHNPPLLLRSVGQGKERIERLEEGGTVLGLFRDFEYEDREVRMERGDVLAVFTDGLIEARSPGNEEYGEQRLIENLMEFGSLPAAGIVDAILEGIKSWTAGAEQEDDLTLVVFKVK